LQADDSSGEVLSYVSDALYLKCDVHDADYERAVATASALVVVWPVGVPLFHLLLLFHCRKAIGRRRPTMLSRAISFLWVDYQREIWYWEVVGAWPVPISIYLYIYIDTYVYIYTYIYR